jgi:iron-sulfur cluster assembly accessory protein
MYKITKNLINITPNAWSKINSILSKTNNKYGMLFTATSGGCNGFNYKLNNLEKTDYDTIIKQKPTIINNNNNNNNNNKVIIDPYVEMYLIGTTIDYINEDYSKNIYENKFVFIPDKDIATSCGCGVSFNVK